MLAYKIQCGLRPLFWVALLLLLLWGCSAEEEQRTARKSPRATSKDAAVLDDIDPPEDLPEHLIDPDALQYQGAFRLPKPSKNSSWEYSGQAMTYYPDGDPEGPDDGYPGSIFAVGHDHQQFVSEIDIPVPVISSKKKPKDLDTASTLQLFHDITGGMFGEIEQPRAGLEYLPPQGGQEAGKLYFSRGPHLQDEQVPTHGWSELDLASPKSAGPWYLDDYTSYVTSDYLFEIPEEWGDANTRGLNLAAGRIREGAWAGYGPALFAIGPWAEGNPPSPKGRLKKVVPLLLYGRHIKGNPQIEVSNSRKMKTYKEADDWAGGAWLTAGDKSAVIFVGTKATGSSWYGFANGVVYPTDESSGQEIPEVPPWPHNNRGYWSDGIKAQIIFYDPDDLADVAAGKAKPWDPQPYASLDIDRHMFDPGFDHEREKQETIGAVSFDRNGGILYVFERRADGDKGIIHAFQLKP